MPVGAAENGTTTDNSLERRIVDLEKRVSELEATRNGTPSKASRIPSSGNWKDLKNWRQLRTGMRYDEVRALLGEPENIEGGQIAHWYWGSRQARVVFISDKLSEWSEPR
jgi:outer membrane protein assembly factor BamE (lipoprotein component of BamABCDE complex)